MTPAQLARALAGLAPPLQRALLAQLLAWEAQGRRVAIRDVEAAILSGNTREVVRLILGESVANAVIVGAPPFPDAATAFIVRSPAAIAAASRTEQFFVRAAADAVIDASRIASAALPPRPPSLPRITAPPPAPLSGLLTITRGSARVSGTPGAVTYAGDALRYLRATAHEGIVAAVRAGNVAGTNPRDIARGLRDVVGLGESQAEWVSNLRRELESGDYRTALGRKLLNGPIRQTVAARARSGKALTSAEIDKIVSAYAGKWRAWHAETISRTVSLDLLREGTYAKAVEAQRSGRYGDEPITKRWVTRLDGRERESHRALNGRTIPLEATWNDAGVPRRVPGGYNCRCAMVIRVGV